MHHPWPSLRILKTRQTNAVSAFVKNTNTVQYTQLVIGFHDS